jgi:hypothetical protein
LGEKLSITRPPADTEKKLRGYWARFEVDRGLRRLEITVLGPATVFSSALVDELRPFFRLVAFRKVIETERFFLHCLAA